MDNTSCQKLYHEINIKKSKLILHYYNLSFYPPSIQLHFQSSVFVGYFLLGELLSRSI